MRTPLLVFADDWGRHPSSCQHLVRHLLDRHEVVWVNTIGTRTPRFNGATLKRGLEKMRLWATKKFAAPELPANLRVVNPKMWPSFGSRFSRRLNRGLLTRQLAPFLRGFSTPPIAVTTLPIVSDLVGTLAVQHWVYYCVDDFSLWPGLDQATLLEMDEDLINKADSIVAVSETLQARLAKSGRESRLLTHGVDLEFWREPAEIQGPKAWDGLERPLVVFWGLTDRRMHVATVRQLACDLKKGTILLVGPQADPDPSLLELPRVVHLSPIAFDHLPLLAMAASVLIMPYADLPVTRAMQPLKLKEYLATGRPVVASDLPANRSWFDCLDLASTPEAFSKAVLERIITGLPAAQGQARDRLTGESWSEKARLFEQWIHAEEPTRNGDWR
jgi:glycosyltransferase involved in cell wall biosynthesis